jgi:hypothetical protein
VATHSRGDAFYDVSAAALQEAADEGSLLICDIVYAELCIHFGAHARNQASRLLTLDRGFYGKLFPSLNLRDPSAGETKVRAVKLNQCGGGPAIRRIREPREFNSLRLAQHVQFQRPEVVKTHEK